MLGSIKFVLNCGILLWKYSPRICSFSYFLNFVEEICRELATVTGLLKRNKFGLINSMILPSKDGGLKA